MARRGLRLPGEHIARFTVQASAPAREGGPLRGAVAYTGYLRRFEGRWELLVEWVDVTGGGHRAELPHEVVSALFRGQAAILAKSRSDGAKKALETRKEKAAAEGKELTYFKAKAG